MSQPTKPDPSRLPPHVKVLRDFANTVDVETGAEALSTADDLRRWLQHYELLDATTAVGEADLRRAHDLRAGLRAAMVLNHDQAVATAAAGSESPTSPPGLTELARQLPIRLDFTTGQPQLEPIADGVDAAFSRLLLAVVAAQSDGTWPRLKLCRASDCLWAFYDASKNRSRTWCAMGVCGNRQKTRAYRARRRAT